jgi:outer membrane protein assembly factor BamC
MHSRILLGALILPAFLMGGCSWTRDLIKSDKVDYKTEGQNTRGDGGAQLEVPPDLTQPTRNSRYEIGGGVGDGSTKRVESARELQERNRDLRPASISNGVLPEVKDMRIERGGSQRWLVIKGKPDQYWQAIKEFWQENGFVLAIDRPESGVMETDWAENRAQIRKDLMGRALGSLLDGVYSTPFRDKFRTRLETTAAGETEVYISHRGMVEIYRNEAREQTTWQERPADPEIEADFLRRLMVRLGDDEARATTVVDRATKGKPEERSKIVKRGDITEVVVDDGFERAWRRVGLALDRVGFTVEDRDRSKGLYYVRYADPDSITQKKSEGWLSKMTSWFNTDKVKPAEQYQIKVSGAEPSSNVVVLSKTGTPEESQTSRRILSLLHEQLK